MNVVDTTQINSFAPIAAQTDFVQPSEEAFFILPSGQVHEIIRQATAPIMQELQDLRTSQEADIERLALDIAHDRQRLAKLEKIEPQPLQKDRGEILCALIAANGGKMLAKDVRKKMRLDEATFSRLLDSKEGFIKKKAYHLDKRQSILIIK